MNLGRIKKNRLGHETVSYHTNKENLKWLLRYNKVFFIVSKMLTFTKIFLMTNVEKVIAGLNETAKHCKELLKDEPQNALIVSSGIERIANSLAARTGKLANQPKSEPSTPETVKTIAGVPVELPSNTPLGKKVEEPTREQIDLLKENVEKIKGRFLDMSNNEISNEVSEMEIRALGKSVGLNVTPTLPEKITVAFYDEIREKIKSQNEEAKRKEAVKNNVNSDNESTSSEAGKSVKVEEPAVPTPTTKKTNSTKKASTKKVSTKK